jgi:hypothetical protein
MSIPFPCAERCAFHYQARLAQLVRASDFYYKKCLEDGDLKVTGSTPVLGINFYFVWVILFPRGYNWMRGRLAEFFFPFRFRRVFHFLAGKGLNPLISFHAEASPGFPRRCTVVSITVAITVAVRELCNMIRRRVPEDTGF